MQTLVSGWRPSIDCLGSLTGQFRFDWTWEPREQSLCETWAIQDPLSQKLLWEAWERKRVKRVCAPYATTILILYNTAQYCTALHLFRQSSLQGPVMVIITMYICYYQHHWYYSLLLPPPLPVPPPPKRTWPLLVRQWADIYYLVSVGRVSTYTTVTDGETIRGNAGSGMQLQFHSPRQLSPCLKITNKNWEEEKVHYPLGITDRLTDVWPRQAKSYGNLLGLPL